jgi:hypothetical protein
MDISSVIVHGSLTLDAGDPAPIEPAQIERLLRIVRERITSAKTRRDTRA